LNRESLIVTSVNRPRFQLACAVSLSLVAAAPFIGEFRRWLAAALPGHYVWIINGAVGLGVLSVAVLALTRIREDRGWRFATLACAGTSAATFALTTGSPVPSVAAVEHFHFVQYGVITALFYRVWRTRADLSSLFLPMSAGVVFGALEEWWQWFLPVRVGDLGDVLLNIVAIACGLLVSVSFAPLGRGWRDVWRQGRRASAAGVLIAALAVAAFTWTVHVGYTVRDPAIGVFMSRYSADVLPALSAQRTAQWAVDPPLVRRTLAREDQYWSEGEAHVRARNDAWARGEVRTAWGENLVLERYYSPVLDTPSHISATGHRWAPEHRSDAERRRAALPVTSFTSKAAVDTRFSINR
jgi:VanZ family protein